MAVVVYIQCGLAQLGSARIGPLIRRTRISMEFSIFVSIFFPFCGCSLCFFYSLFISFLSLAYEIFFFGIKLQYRLSLLAAHYECVQNSGASMYPTLHIFFVVTFAFPSIEIHLAVCIFMRINDMYYLFMLYTCVFLRCTLQLTT